MSFVGEFMYSEDLTVAQYVKEFEQKPWLISTVSPARAIGMVPDEEMHGFLCGKNHQAVAALLAKTTCSWMRNTENIAWQNFAKKVVKTWSKDELRAIQHISASENSADDYDTAAESLSSPGLKSRAPFASMKELNAQADDAARNGVGRLFSYLLHALLNIRPPTQSGGERGDISIFYGAVLSVLNVVSRQSIGNALTKQNIYDEVASTSPFGQVTKVNNEEFDVKILSSLPTDDRMCRIVLELTSARRIASADDAQFYARAIALLVIDPARAIRFRDTLPAKSRSVFKSKMNELWSSFNGRIEHARSPKYRRFLGEGFKFLRSYSLTLNSVFSAHQDDNPDDEYGFVATNFWGGEAA